MPLSIAARGIDEATRKGLLDPDPAVLRPTALGRRFLNDLQTLFLPDAGAARTHTKQAPVEIVRSPAVP